MAVPNQIVASGYPIGIFTFTYLLAGTYADDAAIATTAGKVVTFDSTAASTMKLSGDGDPIHGRVYVPERRAVLGINVASVARKFKELVPVAAGYTPVVGDRVVGGGNGTVKKATANTGAGVPTDPIVVEVGPAGFVAIEYL